MKYTKQFIVRDIMARRQSRYEIILLRSMRDIEVFGGVQFARCSLVSTERKKKEIKTKLGSGWKLGRERRLSPKGLLLFVSWAAAVGSVVS